MLTLAFETSAKAGSVALVNDGCLLGESYLNTALTHSQTLLSMAQSLISHCGLTPQDIQSVAVAAGPGSFTGIRIGVAAAKGFSWAKELPCYGVSTLEAMALGLGAHKGYILPVMDARREQVYTALFYAQDGVISRIGEDRAISLEQLCQDLKDIKEDIFLVGDGSDVCYAALQQSCKNLILPPEHRKHQRAAGVALSALRMMRDGATGDAATLTPNYLRLSQAERERLAREEKK